MEQKQAAVVKLRRKKRIAAGLVHTRKGKIPIHGHRAGAPCLGAAPAMSVDAARRAVLRKALGATAGWRPCRQARPDPHIALVTTRLLLTPFETRAAALKVLPYFAQLGASMGTYAIGITATQVGAERCAPFSSPNWPQLTAAEAAKGMGMHAGARRHSS